MFRVIARWTLCLLALVAPAFAQLDRAALAEKLAPLVEEGNAEAAYHLGMMRLIGIGGAKDEAAAISLFRKATEAGEPMAAYKLGDLLTKGLPGLLESDRAEGMRLKAIAAEAGHALAQHDVARLYFEDGNTELALEWLTRSAQQGQPEALRALASLHNSEAIPKDAARTFAYYTMFLQRIAKPTQAQTDWIAGFSATMPADDRARGERIVEDWVIDQTPLTRKAQSGLAAADALLKPPPEPATSEATTQQVP